MEYFEQKFPQLDRLIREYDIDSRSIRIDTVIMENYPKVFTLMSASVFERLIKEKLVDFINNPLMPLSTYYPRISAKHAGANPDEKAVDYVYGRLFAYLDTITGMPCLSADEFYDVLGGASFKTDVQTEYNSLLEEQRNYEEGLLPVYMDLISKGDVPAQNQYAFRDEIVTLLSGYSFTDAERCFLEIKYRRNRVAHDYVSILSDSFADIRAFYYGAAIYVIAIANCIDGLRAP